MSEMTKAHCNRCGGQTNQEILFSSRHDAFAEPLGYVVQELFETLRCHGCDKLTTRVTTFFSDKEGDFYAVQYPPVMARRTPDWIEIPDEIPPVVIDLMYEVYTAVQNRLARLAAMGIRAALEYLIIDKVEDQGMFTKNLDAFQAAGYISLRQRNSVEAILEAGHASIHRGWEPKENDITTLLDITESVIESVYLHEDQARNLEKRVPRRTPKKKRS
jgi:hypothetical protein